MPFNQDYFDFYPANGKSITDPSSVDVSIAPETLSWVKVMRPVSTKLPLFDIGAGSGALIAWLKKEGLEVGQVTGVENSPYAVANAITSGILLGDVFECLQNYPLNASFTNGPGVIIANLTMYLDEGQIDNLLELLHTWMTADSTLVIPLLVDLFDPKRTAKYKDGKLVPMKADPYQITYMPMRWWLDKVKSKGFTIVYTGTEDLVLVKGTKIVNPAINHLYNSPDAIIENFGLGLVDGPCMLLMNDNLVKFKRDRKTEMMIQVGPEPTGWNADTKMFSDLVRYVQQHGLYRRLCKFLPVQTPTYVDGIFYIQNKKGWIPYTHDIL